MNYLKHQNLQSKNDHISASAQEKLLVLLQLSLLLCCSPFIKDIIYFDISATKKGGKKSKIRLLTVNSLKHTHTHTHIHTHTHTHTHTYTHTNSYYNLDLRKKTKVRNLTINSSNL